MRLTHSIRKAESQILPVPTSAKIFLGWLARLGRTGRETVLTSNYGFGSDCARCCCFISRGSTESGGGSPQP